jgi:hypothetical protein
MHFPFINNKSSIQTKQNHISYVYEKSIYTPAGHHDRAAVPADGLCRHDPERQQP